MVAGSLKVIAAPLLLLVSLLFIALPSLYTQDEEPPPTPGPPILLEPPNWSMHLAYTPITFSWSDVWPDYYVLYIRNSQGDYVVVEQVYTTSWTATDGFAPDAYSWFVDAYWGGNGGVSETRYFVVVADCWYALENYSCEATGSIELPQFENLWYEIDSCTHDITTLAGWSSVDQAVQQAVTRLTWARLDMLTMADYDLDVFYVSRHDGYLCFVDVFGNVTNLGVRAKRVGGTGDIDNDGDLDIVFVNENDNLCFMDLKGNVSIVPIRGVGAKVGFVGGPGDFDFDGDLDIPGITSDAQIWFVVDRYGNTRSLGGGAGLYPVGWISDVDLDGDNDYLHIRPYMVAYIDVYGNMKSLFMHATTPTEIGGTGYFDNDNLPDVFFVHLGLIKHVNRTGGVTTINVTASNVGGVGRPLTPGRHTGVAFTDDGFRLKIYLNNGTIINLGVVANDIGDIVDFDGDARPLTATANWRMLESGVTRMSAVADWHALEINESALHILGWLIVDAYSGSPTATGQWELNEYAFTWLSTSADWSVCEELSFTIIPRYVWVMLELVEGGGAPLLDWQICEYAELCVMAPADWLSLEATAWVTETVAVYIVCEQIQYDATAEGLWRWVEQKTGEVLSTSIWQFIALCDSLLSGTAEWLAVEQVRCPVSAIVGVWHVDDELYSALHSLCIWVSLSEIDGIAKSCAWWYAADEYVGSLTPHAYWQFLGEEYAGLTKALVSWHLLEAAAQLLTKSILDWQAVDGLNACSTGWSVWLVCDLFAAESTSIAVFVPTDEVHGLSVAPVLWQSCDVLLAECLVHAYWHDIAHAYGCVCSWAINWVDIGWLHAGAHAVASFIPVDAFNVSIFVILNWVPLDTYIACTNTAASYWSAITTLHAVCQTELGWLLVASGDASLKGFVRWLICDSCCNSVVGVSRWQAVEGVAGNLSTVAMWSIMHSASMLVRTTVAVWQPHSTMSARCNTSQAWVVLSCVDGRTRGFAEWSGVASMLFMVKAFLEEGWQVLSSLLASTTAPEIGWGCIDVVGNYLAAVYFGWQLNDLSTAEVTSQAICWVSVDELSARERASGRYVLLNATNNAVRGKSGWAAVERLTASVRTQQHRFSVLDTTSMQTVVTRKARWYDVDERKFSAVPSKIGVTIHVEVDNVWLYAGENTRLIVKVFDAMGRPMVGALLVWSVNVGHVLPLTPTTDNRGVLVATYLSPAKFENTVKVKMHVNYMGDYKYQPATRYIQLTLIGTKLSNAFERQSTLSNMPHLVRVLSEATVKGLVLAYVQIRDHDFEPIYLAPDTSLKVRSITHTQVILFTTLPHRGLIIIEAPIRKPVHRVVVDGKKAKPTDNLYELCKANALLYCNVGSATIVSVPFACNTITLIGGGIDYGLLAGVLCLSAVLGYVIYRYLRAPTKRQRVAFILRRYLTMRRTYHLL